MKQKTRWHDALVLAAVLCAAFLIVTGTQQITGRIDGVASMVFVLAVFLISIYTDGYVLGVVASLIGVLGGMPGGVFRAQGLEINYERRKVFVDGAEIKLTQTEYNIVAFLSEHAGRVMTYAAIVRAIWGDTDCGSTKKLQVNMANIRKKLGSVPGRNTYILNELGVGYRMIDEDTDARPES